MRCGAVRAANRGGDGHAVCAAREATAVHPLNLPVVEQRPFLAGRAPTRRYPRGPLILGQGEAAAARRPQRVVHAQLPRARVVVAPGERWAPTDRGRRLQATLGHAQRSPAWAHLAERVAAPAPLVPLVHLCDVESVVTSDKFGFPVALALGQVADLGLRPGLPV